MNESCHTYEWVMSHIWMSHVTHTNKSCHTCQPNNRNESMERDVPDQWSPKRHQHLEHVHSYMYHDSLICVTWLIHVCHMTQSWESLCGLVLVSLMCSLSLAHALILSCRMRELVLSPSTRCVPSWCYLWLNIYLCALLCVSRSHSLSLPALSPTWLNHESEKTCQTSGLPRDTSI